MLKKSFFYFLSITIFFLIVLFSDFILSNTVLKYNHCVEYTEYFYELKKNCKGKYRFKKSFPLVNTYTDEIGLRVGKNKVKKFKNKENIFLFGDSFTYGVGIEYEKTFAGLIAKDLKDFNVYNFGVGSYSTSVHLFKLQKIIEKNIIPKKIFVFLDLTDVIDESTRWYYDDNDKKTKLRNNNLYKKSEKLNQNFTDKNFKLLKNLFSYINYYLRDLKAKIKLKTLNKYKIKTSIQGNFTYTDLNELDARFWKKNTFENGINNIKLNFDKIIKISEKYNFKVYLVIYPWAETLEYGQDKFSWSEFGQDLCINERCNTIDAIPEFKDYQNNNPSWVTDLYFLNDEHFNTKGAELLSTVILKNLNKNND